MHPSCGQGPKDDTGSRATLRALSFNAPAVAAITRCPRPLDLLIVSARNDAGKWKPGPQRFGFLMAQNTSLMKSTALELASVRYRQQGSGSFPITLMGVHP